MTLPFENDTSKVVRRLARRSLQADRRRNLFVILTIALAVGLMSMCAFLFSAGRAKTVAQIRDRYQAGCLRLSIEEINRLVETGKFEIWGYETESQTIRYHDTNLNVKFMDAGMRDLLQISPITGDYPKAEDELCVERGFLDYFGLSDELGQSVTLDVGYGEQRYRISGILEKENNSRLFETYISQAAVVANGGDNSFSIRFRFVGSDIEQPEQLKANIQAFYHDMGISEDRTFYSSNYFDLSDMYLGSDVPVYLIALLIAIACSLVIYSIFYISVMSKIREYGRLKVIGATPKQLQHVVKRERRVLTLAGIPIGLLCGAVFSCLLIPGYWDWDRNMIYAMVIVLMIYPVVLISTRKPLKLVGRVSAIEAIRSTGYNNGGAVVSKQLRRRLTTFQLARMNFMRNRRKSIMTLISLGLTGVMTICVAAYANSIDAGEMARSSFGDRSDYLLSAEIFGPELPAIQAMNPLGESVQNQLTDLDGVSHISVYSAAAVTIEQIPQKDSPFLIEGYTREQMDMLISDTVFQAGAADYDSLVAREGILLVRIPDNLMKLLYHTDFQVGDQVTLKGYNGNTKTYTVMGIIDDVQVVNTTHFFILPEEELHAIYPEVDNFTTYINVHADAQANSKQLRQAIFNLINNPDVTISSVEDYAIQLGDSLQKQEILYYGIVVFVAMFALLNLINTLMTNLLSRQQDFGIFQSIGMSNRQLSQMLSYECLLYIGITIIITFTLGTACSIAACNLFNQFGLFGEIAYRFPVKQMLIFVTALLAIQRIFALVAVRFSKGRSLVERIKVIE